MEKSEKDSGENMIKIKPPTKKQKIALITFISLFTLVFLYFALDISLLLHNIVILKKSSLPIEIPDNIRLVLYTKEPFYSIGTFTEHYGGKIEIEFFPKLCGLYDSLYKVIKISGDESCPDIENLIRHEINHAYFRSLNKTQQKEMLEIYGDSEAFADNYEK